MKTTEEIVDIITGNSSEVQTREFYSALEHDDELRKEFNRLKNSWALQASKQDMSADRLDSLYKDFKWRMGRKNRLRKTIFLNMFKYAAIFLFAFLLAGLLFTHRNPEQKTQITETVIVADNGQRSKIILPDSSTIWLNSGSKLVYNNLYGNKNRDLKLEGEAFFQITKNRNLPLIVSCNTLKVTVLGTQFNVNAYPEKETINVTLKSGSVKMQSIKDETICQFLAPGQMGKYRRETNHFDIVKANVENSTAWINGTISFNDTPMRDVLVQLGRRYNIEIDVRNEKIYRSVFTATLKDESLDEIFRLVDFACKVHSKVIRNSANEKLTKIVIN